MNHNLKLVWRRIKADKTNSIINWAGLALSLSVIFIIVMFLVNETAYNHHFKNWKRVYRVLNTDDKGGVWGNSAFIVSKYAQDNIQGVELSSNLYRVWEATVRKGDVFIPEQQMVCVNESFFKLFGIPLLSGNITGFDQSPGSIVVSKSFALKYFGTAAAEGKVLEMQFKKMKQMMTVVAVFDDFPQSSSIKANVIACPEFGKKHLTENIISVGTGFDPVKMFTSWEHWQFSSTYLLLQENVDPKTVEKQIALAGKEHSSKEQVLSLSLQSLGDAYFHSTDITDNTTFETGSLKMLYVLSAIGLLILLIAGINYFNLSSAQSFARTKMMAIKQICGSEKRSLVIQDIIGSLLIALSALPVAIAVTYLTLPYVSKLLSKGYELSFSHGFGLAFAITAFITLMVGAISGLLVSAKVSSFSVVEALKSRTQLVTKGFPWQKALIVFQLSIFIILIALVIMVAKQVDYVMNTNMGFSKEGLLKINLGNKNYEIFAQEISKNPNVLSVTAALWVPPHTGKMVVDLNKKGKPEEKVTLRGDMVGYDFVKTMGLEIYEGRDFTRGVNFLREGPVMQDVILSKSAVEALELKNTVGEETPFGKIVAVVSDFKFSSLHDKQLPMILWFNPFMSSEIAVRINTANSKQTIDFLRATWNKIEGDTEFEFEFTDQRLAKLYEADTNFARLIGILAFIAIAIAGFGLFGLSLLMSKQKTKEIGVRKVNGAKISEVLTLLNKSYIVSVIIAFVIATPIAYYAMNRWLEGFAYKTPVSWWIFAIAGLSALLIALLTVSWQSWKAATRNPVEALRYE